MTQPFNLTQIQTANDTRDKNGIVTYGALLLPFDVVREKVQNDVKTTNTFKGKLRSALKNASNNIKNAIAYPSQTLKNLAQYMKDNRNEISGLMNTIGSKFSGIAVAQTLINGKVTSREALDYLFMGFAPALGIQGSLMGYSGLNQLKDALFNGSINVGAFVSGFSRTLKGAIDLKDMLTNKQARTSANVIQFDLTISHNETMQSETPDRRVQSGQSLNEFVHNMPQTFEVQCALQEGKRYSKAEFRAILDYLRNRKEVVQLVLGDELFDNLILTNFNSSNDCTKSGMDYTLSFKKITFSEIDDKTEVTVQVKPQLVENQTITNISSSGTGSLKDLTSSKVQMPTINQDNIMKDVAQQLKNVTTKDNGSSWAYAILDEWGLLDK